MRWSAQGPCGVSLNALPLAASAGRGLVPGVPGKLNYLGFQCFS